jgi:hypothetical protein
MLVSNKSLKFVPRVARHWTPSTGAASQLITGFGRHLAPRYAPSENVFCSLCQ